MDKEHEKKVQSLSLLGIVIFLIAISAFLPASWIGGEQKIRLYPKLNIDLAPSDSITEIASDLNNDGTLSWGEVVSATIDNSTSTREKLASIPVDKKSVDELNDPNNLTASFSKNLYLNGVYLDKNNIQDDASKKAVAAKLIQDEAQKIRPTLYTSIDIKIAKIETKDTLKKYGNDVASILENILSEKSIKSDLTSIATYTQTKNVTDLLPLVKNRDRVNTVLQKLLSLSVPPSATMQHVVTLNRVVAYRDVLDNFSKSDSDPLRANLVLDSYIPTTILVGRVFTLYSNYFMAKNITFGSGEAGYVFVTGYTVPK